MFIYLSKKIAIPNGVKLHSVSWNADQGWIACGGEGGLLKILKLEAQPSSRDQPTTKGIAAPSNLSMNQPLEGHQGAVTCVTWNDQFRKLTSSDQNGLIIVWLLYKGMWFEEMINNRYKSVVKDMKWTSDGQKICIVYEDGAVIVGSVDGNRIWGKELPKVNLQRVEWSPDGGRHILFGTSQAEVHVYDGMGNFISKVPLFCVDKNDDVQIENSLTTNPANTTAIVQIIGIDWYDGSEGYVDPNAPSLAIAFENGKIQIMRHENDEKPVLIDTGMKLTCTKWNPAGSILACAGVGNLDGKDQNSAAVQFYTPFGQHIRTLRVPGGGISGLSWEREGLRLALAVDSFLYFANIRPSYRWGSFGHTIVYAFTRPDRPEHCVVFWDTKSDERYVKYVKKLLAILAAGDHCVLVTKTDDASDQYILILCNSIGTPLDSKYTEVEPISIAMNRGFVVIASESYVYMWQFRSTSTTPITPYSSRTTQPTPSDSLGMLRKESKEKFFHIDDMASGTNSTTSNTGKLEFSKKRTNAVTHDQICCLTASDSILMIGRESGTVQRYTFPDLRFTDKCLLRCRPYSLALNCTSSRMSVIDINGILTLVDLDPLRSAPTSGQKQAYGLNTATLGNTNTNTNANAANTNNPPIIQLTETNPQIMGKQLNFERKDVWDMHWATDNPELFAIMEKTRMYIYRGLNPEEPILSSGYICSFHNLKIKAVLLDEVMLHPEHPERDMVLTYETKSLRDTRDLLANGNVIIRDTYQFIDDNPHPRLWRILAENALERLDFQVAERAFVKCSDYQGIQFVKRLQILDDKPKQRAEVASYFKRFNEAEVIYRDIDRRDLAIDLRMRLGDWFKVVQLLQSGGGGDDVLLQRAWHEIGDYYSERHKWSNAVQYYQQAKAYDRLAECYYIEEDYAALEELSHSLPEGVPLLLSIGEKFVTVGLCEMAVTALLKGGDVNAAIECCVHLNQWDQAVQLAEQHNFPAIEALLGKYATHLLEKDKILHAIELYRKANHHKDAARLLFQLAKEAFSTGNTLRSKQLYVLGALEVELYRTRLLEHGGSHRRLDLSAGAEEEDHFGSDSKNSNSNNNNFSSSLDGLLQDASTTSKEKWLENGWRGAEALHFYMLAQRQLYEGYIDAAMKTSLRLREYEDILPIKDIHSLIALTAFHNKYYGQCSKSFIKLESLPEAPNEELEKYQELALSIFVQHPPNDPPSKRKYSCPSCASSVRDWASFCPSCNISFPPCIISGRSILDNSYTVCRVCKHKSYEHETRGLFCALCHHRTEGML